MKLSVAPISLITVGKGGHKSICRSPGSVPVSHLDYFGLTQICGNTCAQVPEPMGQVPVIIQVPMSMQQKYSHQGNCIAELYRIIQLYNLHFSSNHIK
jgi:hypothetical protein